MDDIHLMGMKICLPVGTVQTRHKSYYEYIWNVNKSFTPATTNCKYFLTSTWILCSLCGVKFVCQINQANSGTHFLDDRNLDERKSGIKTSFASWIEYFQVLRASSNQGNWRGAGGLMVS